MCSLTFFFILLGTYLVMEADYASPHVNPAPYPVTDDEGYYMAYKDGDTWVNWWSKSKWGLLGLLAQFLFTKVSIRYTFFTVVVSPTPTSFDFFFPFF